MSVCEEHGRDRCPECGLYAALESESRPTGSDGFPLQPPVTCGACLAGELGGGDHDMNEGCSFIPF